MMGPELPGEATSAPLLDSYRLLEDVTQVEDLVVASGSDLDPTLVNRLLDATQGARMRAYSVGGEDELAGRWHEWLSTELENHGSNLDKPSANNFLAVLKAIQQGKAELT